MVLALLPHRLLGIGYSEVALETRHVFCRIALWDSVYSGHLCICDGNENGEKRNRFRSAKTRDFTFCGGRHNTTTFVFFS